MIKEKVLNPKINLQSKKVGMAGFKILCDDIGVKGERLGDVISDIAKEYYLENLLDQNNEKIYLMRILAKHNSKLFNDSRTNMPMNLIERYQMGFRYRYLNFKDFLIFAYKNYQEIKEKLIDEDPETKEFLRKEQEKMTYTTVVEYYELVKMIANSKTVEIPDNEGYNLMLDVYKSNLEDYKGYFVRFISETKDNFIEPNRYNLRPRESDFESFLRMKAGLGIIAESKSK